MNLLLKKKVSSKVTNKYYELLKRKWAQNMGKMASGLSRKALIFSLTVFVFLSSSVSVFIVYRSLANKPADLISIETLTNPVQLNASPKGNILKSFSLSEQKYKNIIDYKVYLDSLKRSISGQKAYDSIVLRRRSPIDSLIFIENNYKYNFKE
jgi:hypothetical protein